MIKMIVVFLHTRRIVKYVSVGNCADNDYVETFLQMGVDALSGTGMYIASVEGTEGGLHRTVILGQSSATVLRRAAYVRETLQNNYKINESTRHTDPDYRLYV